jgi:hypothetical protein
MPWGRQLPIRLQILPAHIQHPLDSLLSQFSERDPARAAEYSGSGDDFFGQLHLEMNHDGKLTQTPLKLSARLPP